MPSMLPEPAHRIAPHLPQFTTVQQGATACRAKYDSKLKVIDMADVMHATPHM